MILLITESPDEIGPFCVSILAKWGLHVGYVILFVIANSLPTSLPERGDFCVVVKDWAAKTSALRISSSLEAQRSRQWVLSI